MIQVTITRAELEAHKACDDGMILFESLNRMQFGARAKGKLVRWEWTVLHQLWFATAYPDYYSWLRYEGMVPQLSMIRADLGGAYLGGAYLGGADLGGADLRGAYLVRAYLVGAYLGGAYLGGAYLGGAYLGGADLRGADLRGADLRGAYLRGAYLGGADLRGADLRGADRYEFDHPVPGWSRSENGTLMRAK